MTTDARPTRLQTAVAWLTLLVWPTPHALRTLGRLPR